MKKISLLIAAILFCGATFTSCQKENNGGSDSGTNPGKKLVEVKVDYSLNLNSNSVDALNRAYDVKVIYFDAQNQIATREYSASNLEWSTSCTHTKVPCNAGFRFYVTRKADLSGVSETEKFNIEGSFKFNIVAKYSDGSTSNLKEAKNTISYTGIKPSNGRDYSSIRFAYTVDENGKCQDIEIGE